MEKSFRQDAPRSSWRKGVSIALAGLLAGTLYLSANLPTTRLGFEGRVEPARVSISSASFHEGLSKCSALRSTVGTSAVRTRNPRAVKGTKPVLIKNGILWTDNQYIHGKTLLLDEGIIKEIDAAVEVDASSVDVIDAAGRIVTPGLIDMHSHMGVGSWPSLEATEDTNEMTDPLTPAVRVLDGFNPSDPAIKIVASGGITTTLILPGSGNIMGGEATAIKLRPMPNLSVEDMQVSAGVVDEEKKWRYMKMACGENPKRFYGGQGKIPSTRLGEAYLFRQRMQKARQLKRAQEAWCERAQQLQGRHQLIAEPFPEDIDQESLIALLRGDVLLNVHCYEPMDIEAMVRHSVEFNFTIAAFHHALQAHKVTEIIKRGRGNITVATFADMWGYKKEAFPASVHAPKILTDAGIPVAFKSDHAVLNSQDLVYESAKAYHYGLNEHLALAAVTSVPAHAMGIAHRVGRLAVGMDADVVIWEQHPLTLGARPTEVIIDGVPQDFGEERALTEMASQEATVIDRARLPPNSKPSMELEDHGHGYTNFQEACLQPTSSLVLRNVSKIYLDKDVVLDSEEEQVVIVKDGWLACAGSDCGKDKADWPNNAPVFNLQGGHILPGLVSTGARLGMLEIESEESTLDGVSEYDVNDPNVDKKLARAIDGVKMGGLHLEKAYKAGVLTTITNPISFEFFTGISAAFKTGGQNTVLDDDIVIADEAALHLVLGNTAVKKNLPISRQVATIRNLLTDGLKSTTTTVFKNAAVGKLPIVVYTENKDEIASVIQIQRHLRRLGGNPKFVIMGGIESWMVADHLADADIPVILRPARCTPTHFHAQHCLVGPPITPHTALDILLEKGVKVGLASLDADDGYVRNLIWDAGWNLATNPKLTQVDAVGLVSWNIADMFQLKSDVGRIKQGARAEFVAYNGNPFEFGTEVQLIVGGGRKGVECFPKQI
ncbi:hypothetical protein BZG36_02194 [Bifiguratus adelaidae]|uniref:Amidohydrolase-related domain-containing protein n=1 Tax=Bifiguratus adelaidae TaxID=1938954 RepID=A0A261Y3G8_9FUNG|nr:hypothetical protein BZG36_02194 [Bifiguratus adelaidae]